MALSFACPGCKAELQLPDELAGQSGRCPRCQRVILIPSSSQPKARVLDEPPPAVPATEAKPVPAKAVPPPVPKAILVGGKPESSPRPARVPDARPSAPIWAWLLGILASLISAGLLAASVVILVRGDPTKATKSAPKAGFGQNNVSFGRLDGERATLQQGRFQVRTEVTPRDRQHPFEFNARYKHFEVELQARVTYIVELESTTIDPFLEVEHRGNVIGSVRGDHGRQNALLEFTPEFTSHYIVKAGHRNGRQGPFTLTIREEGALMP